MNTTNGGIETVLITERLSRRRLRPAAHCDKNRVFATAAIETKHNPRQVPQKLVNAALKLCAAGSAGISVLRQPPQDDHLCWNAVAGQFAGHDNVVTPRDFSPCGTTLEANAAQLFYCPGRFFTYLNGLGAPVVELLVVPIQADEAALGTMWIASHDTDERSPSTKERQFDAGDLRIMVGLAEFAAVALQRVAALERSAALKPEPEHTVSQFPRLAKWRSLASLDRLAFKSQRQAQPRDSFYS